MSNTINAESREKARGTPLIFRTGLLYSYRRTFLMAFLVTLSGFIISVALNAWVQFLSFWSVIWIFIWLGATYLVRKLVRGLVCLFGLPTNDDINTRYPKENITKQKCVRNYEETLAYAVAMNQKYDYSPNKRKPVPKFLRALFENEADFIKYREKVSKVLFSRVEIPLGILFFVIYLVFWWIPTSLPWSLAGVTGNTLFELVLVYLHWCIITGFWFIEALLIASFAKIFLAMLYGTFVLSRKPEGLRIYKYLHFLDRRGALVKDIQDDGIANEEVVDLEIFSKLTKPIGRVFTEVTMGIIGILVVLDLYWLLIAPPSGSSLIYPSITLAAVLLMFILPQLALHLMLNEYKTVINERLVRTRMYTNTRLIKGTSMLSEQTIGKVDRELEPYISLHKTVVDVLDTMISKLNRTRTWPIDTSMIMKLSSGTIFEVILIVLGSL